MSRITIDSRQFDDLLDDLRDMPELVMKDTERYFVRITPKDKGNAQRNTKLTSKTTILANYAYAGRLDEGWSKQAPNGMTGPAEDYLVRQIDRYVGRL